MFRLLFFLILLPIFGYTYFAVSWTGSYIMLEEDWKEHLVITPVTAVEPQQIYEIDKFLYAFKIQPSISIVCLLSFLILIGIIFSWIRQKFGYHKKIIVN